MKASEARRLKLEDRVVIHCGTIEKIGMIINIEWPVFTISLLDSRGRPFMRQRRYKSLRQVEKHDRVPVEFLKPNELPSWLEFPVNDEFEVAADYCADVGLDQAAITLRDPRCNRVNNICLYRDRPHRDQFEKAASILEDFPAARSKLLLYVSRLDELS